MYIFVPSQLARWVGGTAIYREDVFQRLSSTAQTSQL